MLSDAPSATYFVDAITCASYVLPVMACYLVLAVLAVTPGTHITRIALFPVIALLALRVAVYMNVSRSKPELLEAWFACFMFSVVTRALDWAMRKDPLVRHFRPGNSAPSIILDAIDLSVSARGLGWDWSHGIHVPRETRPTDRIPFAFWTFISTIVHALMNGICHRAFVSFAGVASVAQGWTIVDESLPFFLRYLRSSIISVLFALSIYASLQTFYNAAAIPAVLLLRQDPAQWPPAFDAPWCATSLHDFWGRRWHQWIRRSFIVLGGHPLSMLFGDIGIVIGAFLSSVIAHDIILIRIDKTASVWWMLIGFGMMAPGLLIERAFRQLTGKKVEGVWGWMWTMAWMIILGNVIVEGGVRTGAFVNNGTFIDGVAPLRSLVERSVIDFDAWLHSI